MMEPVSEQEIQIPCEELGVYECDYVARAKTPAEAAKQIVEHLRSEHGLHLPDVDEILGGRSLVDRLSGGRLGKDEALVMQRLRERLHVDSEAAVI